MFSLIITIISIALVVALIAATAYYGGDTLTEGRNSADAAAYVAGGQQIAGATHAYIINKGTHPADMDDLVLENLLISPPNVKSRSVTNEWVFDTLGEGEKRIVKIKFAGEREDNQKLCEKINRNAGASGIDSDTGAVTPAQAESMHYACVDFSAELPQVFIYKY